MKKAKDSLENLRKLRVLDLVKRPRFGYEKGEPLKIGEFNIFLSYGPRSLEDHSPIQSYFTFEYKNKKRILSGFSDILAIAKYLEIPFSEILEKNDIGLFISFYNQSFCQYSHLTNDIIFSFEKNEVSKIVSNLSEKIENNNLIYYVFSSKMFMDESKTNYTHVTHSIYKITVDLETFLPNSEKMGEFTVEYNNSESINPVTQS
jgi:hypothetical protein